jgi:hypothetical protein
MRFSGICPKRGERSSMPGKWGIMRVTYSWEKLYEAAVLETDGEKLHDLIHAAKAAIDSRLEDMQSHHDENPEERHAMMDALHGLMVLRSELEAALNKPHPKSV